MRIVWLLILVVDATVLSVRVRRVGSGTIAHRKLRRLQGAIVVPNQYLVVLNSDIEDVPGKVDELLRNKTKCGTVSFTYQLTLKAFALTDCPEEDLNEILDDDAISHAIEDEVVSGDTVQDARGLYWLDYLDQPAGSPLDGKYRYELDGSNVTIYMLDTGIRTTHNEFKGRAVCGFNAYADSEPCEDNEGHGSFTAGGAAGKTYGVAKNATIVAVRVLDRDVTGSLTKIIAGLEYVATEKQENPSKPMVVNMSLSTTPLKGFASCPDGYALGCGLEQANEFLDAVEALVAVGIVVVVSAGNTYIPGRSACLSSPGKSDKVITVGGSTAQGRQWRNSKDGICVDIFAPAKDVTSAWAFSDRSTSVQSGTSIAAPIVAGVAALYLQRDSTMTPAAVKQAILDDAIKGVKWKGLLSPNRLVSTTGLM